MIILDERANINTRKGMFEPYISRAHIRCLGMANSSQKLCLCDTAKTDKIHNFQLSIVQTKTSFLK